MKRSFTLLEVLVAFGLMALITGLIFGTVRRNSLLNRQTAQLHKMALERKNFQERLATFIRKSDEITTKDNRLNFSYFSELDPDPNFCAGITGEIFLEKGHLYLTLQSEIDPEKVRKEVIFKDVQRVTYRFADLTEEEAISSEWPAEKESLPSLIFIDIFQKDQEALSFCFHKPREEGLFYPSP